MNSANLKACCSQHATRAIVVLLLGAFGLRAALAADLVFSPDGQSLAMFCGGSRGGDVKLLDVATGATKQVFSGFESDVRALAFSVDGSTLASESGPYLEETVTLWTVATGRRMAAFEVRHANSLAFSPDGKLLAADGYGLRFYDLATGQLKGTFGNRSPEGFAFSPDGKTVAVTGGGSLLRLIDLRTGRFQDFNQEMARQLRLRIPKLRRDFGSAAQFLSGDGTTLAIREPFSHGVGSSPAGFYLTLWDVRNGQLKSCFHVGDQPCGVVISHDGKMALTTAGDDKYRLWDAAKGKACETLEIDGMSGQPVFSPDGKKLAYRVVSRQDTCRFLDVPDLSLYGPPSFAGEWEVPSGPLALTVRGNKVTGTYPFYGGRVEGVLSNGGTSVTGVWMQSNGVSGGFVLRVSADSQRIEGRRWIGNNNDAGSSYPWSGARVGDPVFVRQRDTSTGPPPPNDGAIQTDPQKIEGEWRVASAERDGMPMTAKLGDVYTFADGTLTVQTAHNPPTKMTYTLDPAKTPKRFDLRYEASGQVQLSSMIYSLAHDTLVICYAPPARPRPTELATKPGDQRTVIVLKRGSADGEDQYNQPPSRAEEPDFVQLLKGKDLSGWHQMRSDPQETATGDWTVHNGTLTCSTDTAGWLKSPRQYGDFLLEMEFKIPPGGNSGVLLRHPGTSNLSETGMEIQIIDDNDPELRELRPEQRSGAIYGVAGPAVSALLPEGHWNSLRIACRGDLVGVAINGKLVAGADLSGHDRLRHVPPEGFIGLYNWQGKAQGTAFRNIRIKELTRQSSEEAQDLLKFAARTSRARQSRRSGNVSGTTAIPTYGAGHSLRPSTPSIMDQLRRAQLEAQLRAMRLRQSEAQLRSQAINEAQRAADRAMRDFRSRHNP